MSDVEITLPLRLVNVPDDISELRDSLGNLPYPNTYNPIVETTDLLPGMVVAQVATPSTVQGALANAAATSTCTGMLLGPAPTVAGQRSIVRYIGLVDLPAASWPLVTDEGTTLTTGARYYASAVNIGKITKTAPADPNIPQQIGIALSPVVMFVDLGAPGGSSGGGGGGTFQKLTLTPRAPDPFGLGTNMPAGYVANYSDPSMPAFSRYLWKGADNQGTWLTGIDATGFGDGDIVIFENQTESGIDTGVVVLKDETSPEATGGVTPSLAANRIVCPGAMDYVCAPFGVTILVRGTNKLGQPRWEIQTDNGYQKKALVQSLQFYPNMQAGLVTPLVGTLNDWNPVGDTLIASVPVGSPPQNVSGSNCAFQDHSWIMAYVDAAGARITGLLTQYPPVQSQDFGPIKVITNNGPGVLTIADHGVGSAAENQILCPNGVDYTVQPGESVWLASPYYDNSITPQWRVLGPGNAVISTTQITDATIQQLQLAPSLAPAALPSVPAVTHDWDPGGNNAVIRVNTNPNGSFLGGLAPHAPLVFFPDDTVRVLRNIGSGPLIILNEDAGSLVGNRFETPNGQALYVEQSSSVIIIRDGTLSRWRCDSTGNVLASPTLVPITPAAALIGANNNDYSPVDGTTGLALQYGSWLRVTGTFAAVLTGIDATGFLPGQRLMMTNYGAAFTISNNNAASLAANRFTCPNNADIIFLVGATVTFIRDPGGIWIAEGMRSGGA
jgi:hypothetical protein